MQASKFSILFRFLATIFAFNHLPLSLIIVKYQLFTYFYSISIFMIPQFALMGMSQICLPFPCGKSVIELFNDECYSMTNRMFPMPSLMTSLDLTILMKLSL